MRIILILVAVVSAYAAGFFTGHKYPHSQDAVRPGFFWMKGVLEKSGKAWLIRRSDSSKEPVKAVPWPALPGVWGSKVMEVEGPEGKVKYERSGPWQYPGRNSTEIPYSVGIESRFFGTLCETPEQHAEFMALLYSIWEVFGKDPPAFKIPFEGRGFYIVVE